MNEEKRKELNNLTTKKPKTHDLTLTRLILTLTKLSNNELPTMNDLKEEYNVSLRTIQRDIYERLVYFPIVKDDLSRLSFQNGFSLDRCKLENDEMLLIYLAMSQVKDISVNFNSKIDSIFAKLLNPAFSSTYFMKPQSFEKIDLKSKLFENIENSIKNNQIVEVLLKNRKTYIEPYKILSLDGIWHIMAKDLEDQKVKIFIISRIKSYDILNTKFKLQTDIHSVLNNVHSSWFSDGDSFKVKIIINHNIADYFKSKTILPTQKILEEKSCGSIIVEFEITHYEDIDNIIKAWLPDIRIIEPIAYKEKFEKELLNYLNNSK